MRLHRLEITDFKGIDHREVSFADTGVTVVNGANEAGKSSMIEALDLLLGERADSKKKSVKAVQPSGRDVGSEVTAELTCGDHRFRYFKRFNSRPETTLTILEPRREQLTGRAAHERVQQILDASLDNALFDALRLLQTTDPDIGGLADSSALSRALDLAVGSGQDSSGTADDDTALVDAVESEYRRYFTATGRETGELATARQAAAEADAEVTARRAARDAVAEAADELPAVDAELRALTDDLLHANEEVASAVAARAQARELVATVEHARTKVAQKQSALQLVERRREERTERDRQVNELAARVTADEATLADTVSAAETADREAAELETSLHGSRTERDRRRSELDAAVAAEAAASVRERIERIDRILAEVTAATTRREAFDAEVAKNPVTAAEVAEANRLSHAITAAQATVDAAAALIEVTALSDRPVEVDGAAIDGTVELTAVGQSVVEVPGVVRVVVQGAASTQALADELAAARRAADVLISRCGVASLDEIADRAEARAAAGRAATEIETAIRRLLDGSTPEKLTAMRDQLAAALPDDESVPELSAAELRVAERDLSDLIAKAERTAADRRAAADNARTRAELLAAGLERLRADLSEGRETLLTDRAKYSDEALDGAVATARADLDHVEGELDAAETEAECADIARLEAVCAEAEDRVARLRERERTLENRKVALRTQLELFRTENRLDELADAEAAASAAHDDLRRVSERAQGARVLHETLNRKRTESRSRYVAPFTACLEELAAPVFGESVRFEVDDDFTITSRTLDGTTVPVSDLSGGAREQLGLIARLACARIVDAADGVPVIVDDALGYSDPDRLASMTAVLGQAATSAQIIVLTCDPDRYALVPDATTIAV
ncbi:MAG: AAA family ATPase [Gordonia sp. (in: high G+C Gram-positive bacteria)]|uniref:AAA family ATPase n=1 Tax=Gordonia sp. (in: high G+C Gram-positive bacteria) TaxID=84139 RepID=UPI0039E33C7F